MTVDYPTAEAPATPEYVLAVLRDALPFEFEEDELDFDTPLVDLACAYNDLAWPRTRLIASCLNNLFATTIPLAEWEAAFPGLRGHTVREVCEFLSPRITQPLIRPWRHICGDCLPAGAFLTIRSLLVGAAPIPPQSLQAAHSIFTCVASSRRTSSGTS